MGKGVYRVNNKPNETQEKLCCCRDVQAVNELVREIERQLEAMIQYRGVNTVGVGGRTKTGDEAYVKLSAASAACIALHYNFAIYFVLGRDFPEVMWEEFARAAGIASVGYIGLEFTINH